MSDNEMPFKLRPEQSARETLVPWQGFFLIFAALLVTALLLWNTGLAVAAFVILTSLLNLVFLVYKTMLVSMAGFKGREIVVDAAEVASVNTAGLPSYSIMVPLYREASVLQQLTGAIDALVYPRDKLEIILLLEENDKETIEACRSMELADNYRLLVVPDSQPKTKPKACSYGLASCRGDLVVVYDAEDVPEADQLLKAALAFSRVESDVICLQAKLNYYNRDQNLLTRLFTLEYSMWFDLFLPGLVALDAPIPLGGTSNHFRRRELTLLGGWDPYNVTEDCDLGMRLHIGGYRTRIISSTTWEEANSQLPNWIRQRSRWVKGYVQTYLVHMRRPLAALKRLGPRHMLDFQLTLGGMFFAFFANPLGWLIMIAYELVPGHSIPLLPYIGSTAEIVNGLALTIGNLAFIFLMGLGAVQRRYYSLLPCLILAPVYWLLMSLGAYKAITQLVYRPHFWEKTQHGLFDPQAGYIRTDALQDERREHYASSGEE